MNYGFLLGIVFCMIILYMIIWIFIKPFKKFAKIMLNSALGGVCLWFFNLAFASTGFVIGVNIYSAAVCGVLGVPGMCLLYVGKWVMGM